MSRKKLYLNLQRVDDRKMEARFAIRKSTRQTAADIRLVGSMLVKLNGQLQTLARQIEDLAERL